MALSSAFNYTMTFLTSLAILIMGVGAWGYYAQPGGPGSEFLPRSTLVLLNDNFIYILALSFIVVLGEWAYQRPKKRKYDGEEYGNPERDNGGSPPMR
jgi:hypothetical protein